MIVCESHRPTDEMINLRILIQGPWEQIPTLTETLVRGA